MKSDLSTITGEILRVHRSNKGYSQQQLGDYAGVDRAHISDIETGKSLPSFEIFFKLAAALKVKPSQILAEIEKKFKP